MSKRTLKLENLLMLNTACLVIVAWAACRDSIGAAYGALFLAAVTAAFYVDEFRLPHPSRLLMNAASIAVMLISAARMRYDNFVVVFTEAILLMMAVKMFEKKMSRDYIQIVLMSAIIIVAAAVEATSGTYVYYCVINSVLAGLQLILSTWYARAPNSSLSLREAAQIAGRAASIWAMMLPLCLLLFFAAPRARLTLGQLPGGARRESFTGFSDHLTLGSVKNIQEDDSLAFRAEMPHIAPKYLFWRGLVLDYFDGNAWRARRTEGERHAYAASDETGVVKQEIFIEDSRYMSPVFAVDVPVMVNTQGVAARGDGVFVNANFRERLRSYTVLSIPSASFKPSSGGIRRRAYLDLPPGYGESIRKQTGEITRGLDDGDIPAAIMKYLSPPDFSYSLDDLPASQEPLEEFLFEARRGNCEYFAAAMTVMLRMADIPARIVAGYHGGAYNESGGYYVVRQSNAHVWVEAWDADAKSWRRYDPTPADERGEGGASEESRYGFFWMYLDFINYRVSRVFMEYERDTQSEILETLREFLASPGNSMKALTDRFSPGMRNIAVFAGGVFLAVIALTSAKNLRARNGKYSKELALRRSFLDAMKRLGCEKKPGEGLEEFARSAVSVLGLSSPAAGWAEEFAVSFGAFYFKDIPVDGAAFNRLNELVKRIKTSAPAKRSHNYNGPRN
jgi:transglutaminase-like putative cysteine protease